MGPGPDCGLAEHRFERLHSGAGLAAPVVVEVVAGDLEQPAAERIDRAAEPGESVDGADEGGAGEVLGLVAVADRIHKEAEQRRFVGGVDAGHRGRLPAARGNQVGLGQVGSGWRRFMGIWRFPSVIAGCSLDDGIQVGGWFLVGEGLLETSGDRVSEAEHLLSHRLP